MSFCNFYSCKIALASQGNGTSGEAIGTIVPRLTDRFTSLSEANKYLYCDGSTFDISKYPKLYAILGANQLPDLRNRFIEGADVGNQIIEAGLPNIIGYIEFRKISEIYPTSSGVFTTSVYERSDWCGHGDNSWGFNFTTIDFNASRCSTIYRDDITTVQPPAVTVRYYIRAK